jgi:membrane protein YdbS with pleckstrin-like domain
MPDSPGADADAPASDDPGATATTSPSDGAVDAEAYVTGRRTLAPQVRIQWSVRILASAIVVGALGTALAGRIGIDPRLGAGFAGLLALVGFGWVLLRYRVWAYEVRADALYLQRGVATHTRTVVPYVRIQHVDTSRGPFERALGLSTLVVYTAGSRGADVSVPGLTPTEASDLQTRVKELAIEAEGGDAV